MEEQEEQEEEDVVKCTVIVLYIAHTRNHISIHVKWGTLNGAERCTTRTDRMARIKLSARGAERQGKILIESTQHKKQKEKKVVIYLNNILTLAAERP